jgi:hypothetical protein
MPGEADRYAYHLVPGRDPRPGNFEDELVNDFLVFTNQPEWVGDDVEGNLRIALRRAADAAVRTTLDAEKPASGVVYQTAEERAAKKVVRPERASGQDNWTPPIAISALKEVLMKAEDDGVGGVNLTLGYAAVALIERLEHIADALEAKAVLP